MSIAVNKVQNNSPENIQPVELKPAPKNSSIQTFFKKEEKWKPEDKHKDKLICQESSLLGKRKDTKEKSASSKKSKSSKQDITTYFKPISK